MQKGQRLGIWLINLTLVLAVAFAWLLQRTPGDAAIQSTKGVQTIGHLIANQVGNDLPLDLFESQLFEGGISIKRAYQNPEHDGEAPIWLLAVETREDRHAHHPPEYCYTGSGWTVESSRSADWNLAEDTAPMRAVVHDPSSTARELVVYWFTDGHRLVPEYYQRVLYDAWDRLGGKPQVWVMLRVSIPLESPDDEETAERRLKDFAQKIQARLTANT